ncbi:MAG: hypothetical protein HYY25_12380 [Candidatus Wallbacteria bacterium]|nr:hypothetical protein [Candidatus Wallbacteria bacterium]
MRYALAIVCLGLAAMSCAGELAAAERLRGCWVVPESIYREDRAYDLQERRELAGKALDRMKRAGIDTVFLETFVRGYATAKASAGPGLLPIPARYVPASRGEPDLLSLFIEEAKPRGMRVHAWVHLCYFRSDNIARSREDDDTHSLFHDLLVRELDALRSRASGSVRELLSDTLTALERGYDTRALAAALREGGHGFTHTPMQRIVDELREAGLPGPSLFAYGPGGRLHPPLEQVPNGSLYVDPAHSEVSRRLVDMIGSLVENHPGLAGIHLDHIRYPEGDYGYVPRETGGALEFLPPAPRAREKAVSNLVDACRERVAGRVPVSAAVLPGYYQGWGGSGGSQRGAGQDWFRWGLSFYTPMLYGIGAGKLSEAMASYRRGLAASSSVYAGIDSLARARGASWVLFDYSVLERN